MHGAVLVPEAALPYLDAAVPARVQHAELDPLRREALDVLSAGYRSSSRTLLGVLAAAAVAGGAMLLTALPWLTTGVTSTVLVVVLGTALLIGGTWLAATVLRAGRRITRATATWLSVPVTGDPEHELRGVVRWRTVLGAVAAAVAVALSLTLAYVVGRTGVLGPLTPPAGVTDTTRALLVGALAGGALAAAGAALGTFGGVLTIVRAAWQRPVAVAEAASPAGPVGARAEAAAVPPPEEPPTVAIDLSSLHPGAVAAAGAARPGGSTQVEVLLPDGRTLGEGTTLVGRRPVVRPEDIADDVVTLSDQTVTKTHAAITVEGGDVRIVDRASTNGTLLEAADGSLVRCRPWQVTTVRVPAVIHLGRTRLAVQQLATARPLEVA